MVSYEKIDREENESIWVGIHGREKSTLGGKCFPPFERIMQKLFPPLEKTNSVKSLKMVIIIFQENILHQTRHSHSGNPNRKLDGIIINQERNHKIGGITKELNLIIEND